MNDRVTNSANTWEQGYYHPTSHFHRCMEHICVMDEKSRHVIAITGFSHGAKEDEIEESKDLARSVAKLPQMLALLESLYGHHSLDGYYRDRIYSLLSFIKDAKAVANGDKNKTEDGEDDN